MGAFCQSAHLPPSAALVEVWLSSSHAIPSFLTYSNITHDIRQTTNLTLPSACRQPSLTGPWEIDGEITNVMSLQEIQGVRVAVEGCCHGELHSIYASVTEACKQKGWPTVDLLIIGGDFQAVRNAYDLNCVSMPAKYREMHDFHEYYSGQRIAPFLTIFVGGNHEASNYLFELYYGGWVAPNIYYLGAANVIRFGPLRIAAMSGIWNGRDYRKPHSERLPYDSDDLRSIYHVREMDVRKLMQLQTQVDIGISHDWPQHIVWNGNWKQLFRFKPHLEEDSRNGRLGSVAAKQVLDRLRPRYWFSAHLHCKYVAIVDHKNPEAGKSGDVGTAAGTIQKNPDEIDIDSDDADGAFQTSGLKNEPPVKNTEEIELDLEDDDGADDGGELASAVSYQGPSTFDPPMEAGADFDGPSKAQLDARASLPAAFNRREPRTSDAPLPPDITNERTEFLALDKCVPNHHFLQLLEIPASDDADVQRPFKLMYDREWLTIVRSMSIDEPLEVGTRWPKVFDKGADKYHVENNEKRHLWVKHHISDDDLFVPENFEITAPVYDGGDWKKPEYACVIEYPNPQTARYCKMLDMKNPFELSDVQIAQAVADQKAGKATVPLPGADQNSHRGRGGGGEMRGRGGRGGGRGRGRGGFRARGGRPARA
jgi:lariat debranching enzyme